MPKLTESHIVSVKFYSSNIDKEFVASIVYKEFSATSARH